jgi:chaperonin cofactor prefoldin
MQDKTINEAIANISSTSAALEKFCNDPKNYNSIGSQLLEQMSYELHRQAQDLKELQYMYGV